MIFDTIDAALHYLKKEVFVGQMHIMHLCNDLQKTCVLSVNDQLLQFDSDTLLLAELDIAFVLFVPRPTIQLRADKDIIIVDAMLEQIDASSALPRSTPAAPDPAPAPALLSTPRTGSTQETDALIYRIATKARVALGPSGSSKILTIATEHPPETDFPNFEAACKRLLRSAQVEPASIEVLFETAAVSMPTTAGNSALDSIAALAAKYCGPRGAHRVFQIAQQHPLDTDPSSFVAKCLRLLQPYIGSVEKTQAMIDRFMPHAEPLEPSEPTLSVQTKASNIFSKLYGANGADKVTALMEKYPPDTQHDEFLRECIKMVSTQFGANKAKQMFGDCLDITRLPS